MMAASHRATDDGAGSASGRLSPTIAATLSRQSLSGDSGFALGSEDHGTLTARMRLHDAALRHRLNVSRFAHHLVGAKGIG